MKYATLLLAGALAFCAQGAPAAHAQDKSFNLKLSYWVPPSHPLTPGYKDWAEAIEKATNGTIKVTLFPSSQLGSGQDHYDMVKRGVADIGLINPGYTPGRFPVIAAADLPFMSTESWKGAAATHRWYKKYAEKEMPDHYVCHVFSHEKATIHSAKKEIKVPADLKGMKVRTANQTIATYITSMGGNSVQVPIMEAHETLKRGITEAITVPWDGLNHPAFRFGEVTDLHARHPALRVQLHPRHQPHVLQRHVGCAEESDRLGLHARMVAARLQALVRGWHQARGRDPQNRSQADQDHPRRAEALAQCRQAGLRGVGGGS